MLGSDPAERCLLQSNSIVLVCKALTCLQLVSAQEFVILKCLLGNLDLIAVPSCRECTQWSSHEYLT